MKLDEIKQHNLARFAQEFYGFTLTAKATARNPVLECGADNIVIKHQHDGSYTFFSPSSNVKGSIVDFVMWRENCNVKQAVAIASEKITGFAADVSAGRKEPVKEVKPVKEFDREKLASLQVAKFNYYLKGRGIDNIDHGRFAGQVMYDPEYKNAIFPHKNQDGEIIGYSIKNSKFNGFSPGGQKSLWRSNQFKNDKQLVVCEAAIDALSYAKLQNNKHPEDFFHTRFISTEGAYDPAVLELIKNEIKAMGANVKVIGAFDNDKKGWEFSEEVKKLCDELKTNYVQDFPRVKGYDWNDVLQKFLEREQSKQNEAAPEVEKKQSVKKTQEKEKENVKQM